jgi:N-acetylmuramoyl-L-alanine amidase
LHTQWRDRHSLSPVPTPVHEDTSTLRVYPQELSDRGRLIKTDFANTAFQLDTNFCLRSGDDGPAVADLQARLSGQELDVLPDRTGAFGAGTRAAVEAFQHRRGLRVDGTCGPQTWSALVEAGFRLGDRFLYHRRLMLRGDDVAELQRYLSALGFDTGRVDGIFGNRTAGALGEFQRNLGLPVDGILGGDTLSELRRVMPRRDMADLVSDVKDRDRLRHLPKTLLGRRIAVGEEGGLDALASAVRRGLHRAGANAVPILHPDGSLQATAANSSNAEVYLGLRLDPTSARCSTAHYSGYRYESTGGRRLAELVQLHVPAALGVPRAEPSGMSLPVLRETKMPAVVCELGTARLVVEKAPVIASALVEALTEWATTSVD